MESLKTNNILKAKQDEKCELHDRVESTQKKKDIETEKAKEEVQVSCFKTFLVHFLTKTNKLDS